MVRTGSDIEWDAWRAAGADALSSYVIFEVVAGYRALQHPLQNPSQSKLFRDHYVGKKEAIRLAGKSDEHRLGYESQYTGPILRTFGKGSINR